MINKMINKTPATLISLSILALSACDRTPNDGGYFFRSAGVIIEDDTFGHATLNNLKVQTGEREATNKLGERFANEVNPTVNFAFNSTVLNANAKSTLRQQASWIKQFPEVRFKVYGHTDLVGSAAYNERLGLARAEAVVKFLTNQGIDKSRLEAVVTLGETRPVIATNNESRQNRRTVTEVIGFVGNHANALNGEYASVVFRSYVGDSE